MRVKALFVALLVASLGVVAPPARAADNAVCTAVGQLAVNPGLALTPTVSTFSTLGAVGTIDCHGSVRGQPVTGPGVFTNDGVIDRGTCAEGRGTG